MNIHLLKQNCNFYFIKPERLRSLARLATYRYTWADAEKFNSPKTGCELRVK
jgi:hypothetical protein